MDPNQNAESQPNAAQTGGTDLLKRIAAEAGVGGKQKPEGQAPVVDQTASLKDLEVDVGGGVKRRVPMEDLVKAYNQRTELDTSKQAVQRALAEMGELESLRSLKETLANLDGPRRKRLLELLTPGNGRAADDDESLADEAFGDGNSSRANGHADDRLQAVLDRLDRNDQVLTALATRENGRLRAERTEDTGQRVDKLMAQYPVFKEDVARVFAKDSIMSKVAEAKAQSPEAIEGIVQNAAAKLQELVTRKLQEGREEIGVPRTMEGVPKGGFKAGDLRSGKLREIAQRLLTRKPAG